MSNQPEFKFSQNYFVYKPKDQGIYPINESDWNRLKRDISRIIPRRKIFEILYSVCFGIFASAVLSLIAFKSTVGLSAWVLPTTWVILIGSFLFGVSFIVLDKQQTDIITTTVNSVLEEMKQIEQHFDNPQGQIQLKSEVSSEVSSIQ